jgi:phospholipid/cholesterol/gamma-HCH transport system ATP-binding protein
VSTDPGPAGTDDRRVVISVEGLHKSFGDRAVLRGVDLAVHEAENLVVLGRSGSGKSVLIKILVALLRPEAGRVRVLDQPVLELRQRELDQLRQRIGFSFQSSALYDSMTVEENLAFPLRMNKKGLGAAAISAAVHEVLEQVDLVGALRQMPAELSGGQRKRIGIARTLILRPEIMLYDEPTAGLDPVTSAGINDLILEVQRTRGTAAIVITHDLTCARATGNRVALMLEGQVARLGSFDEVFATDDPRVRGFYDYNFAPGGPP